MMIVLVQDNLKLLLIVVYFKLIKIEKGKYFLVDNKRGTGLFIKIKNKICVDHDMIVSFCASHMILQLDGESNE